MVKYELLEIADGSPEWEICKEYDENIIPYRLVATRDFGDVRAGDEGGIININTKLSHNGSCWIYPRSYVFDSIIQDNATVRGISSVIGVKMTGNSRIKDSIVCSDITNNILKSGRRILLKDNSSIDHCSGIITDSKLILKDNARLEDCNIIADNMVLSGCTIIRRASK